MCVLCRDTFSRSDILKRHFQKCSIRRGNPTGASHLSHPQAHVKKNAQAQKAAGLGNEGDMNHLNGLNNMPGDGMVHPFGMVPVQDGMNNMSRRSPTSAFPIEQHEQAREWWSPGQEKHAWHGPTRQPYGNEVQGSYEPTAHAQLQHAPGSKWHAHVWWFRTRINNLASIGLRCSRLVRIKP